MPKSNTTKIVLMVNIEGGFEGDYKPIKLTACQVPVEVELPASEVMRQVRPRRYLLTLKGAALVGEALRSVTRNSALERTI